MASSPNNAQPGQSISVDRIGVRLRVERAEDYVALESPNAAFGREVDSVWPDNFVA